MEAPSTGDLVAHFKRDAGYWARLIACAQQQPATASTADVARWQYYQAASEAAALKLAQLRDLEQAA